MARARRPSRAIPSRAAPSRRAPARAALRSETRVIDPSGRRRLTRGQKAGLAGLGTLLGLAALGLAASLLIDRLLDFDDALDAGGEWDVGGGVFTRWD